MKEIQVSIDEPGKLLTFGYWQGSKVKVNGSRKWSRVYNFIYEGYSAERMDENK